MTRFRSWLESGDRADQAYFTQVQEEAEELATELRRAVLAMESIDIERVFDTVYAEPHRQVEMEKAWLKDYEAGFAEAGEDK